MKPGWKHAACLWVALGCQVASSGLTKQAANSLPGFTASAIATNVPYLLSLACLALNALVWPVVLGGYKLAVAYFMMSGVYVGILLTSVLVFHEPITRGNAAGALLIVVGVNLLGRDGEAAHE